MEPLDTLPGQPVTIPPTDTPEAPLYLADDAAPQAPPKPEVATKRAEKAYIGAGTKTQYSREDMQEMIRSGREQELRDSIASTMTFQASQKKEQALVDAAAKKGSALNYQEAMKIVDPFDPINKPANPANVIENSYADAYKGALGAAAAYMKETVHDTASQEIPELYDRSQNRMSSLISKMEQARTLKQNVDNEIETQGTFSWLADQGKTMFQPYNEIKMRGLVKSPSGWLLGDALKAQADAILDLPGDEYTKQLVDTVAKLRKDNPTLASRFLDYVIGTSSSERKLDNLFTVISPLDYASLGKMSTSLLRKVAINNRANITMRQIVTAAAKTDGEVPIKSVIQEAAGDIDNAAVTRASDNISKSLTGNLEPVQDIKEKFTSNFRLDGDILDSNPGNLTRDQLTWLKDSFYRAGNTLYDTIMQALRVNRTPLPLATEEAVRAYQAAMRAERQGEVILDIGSPTHMRETNTYHVPYTYGDEQGRLFSDPETAYNCARMRGYADPRIQEATGTVVKVPEHLEGTKSDLTKKARLEKSIPETEAFVKGRKATTTKSFIGPRNPEDLASTKAWVQEMEKEVLPKMRAELEAVNKKVVLSQPVIEQNGLGYKFTVVRPYKETDDVVRKYLLNGDSAKSSASAEGFGSWKNSFLGWVRGADDTLSYNETLQRKVATYTQSLVKQWASEEAKAIEEISQSFKWTSPKSWAGGIFGDNKKVFEQFNDTLKYAKTAKDPDGKQGYFFKTPGELQDHYQRWYQRNPSFPEVKAYFAHVKLVEGNRVLSEIAEFRNRARLGAEQHQIFMLGEGSTKVASGYFDGISQNEFPQGGGQILVMGNRKGEERLYNLGANEIAGRDLQKYKDWVEKGIAKIVRIYDPDSFPLQGYSDVAKSNRIRYVLTTDSETKPLDFNHVNRRGGGHFDVDSEYYVKQAIIKDEANDVGNISQDMRRNYKLVYTGDNTLMPIGNRVLGKDVVQKMNQMNLLMREQKIPEAQALAKKLGINWDQIEKWYDAERVVNGKRVGPYIDWNQDFHVVPRNKTIFDLPEADLVNKVGADRFEDGMKSGSDARQFQVAYNQARDSEIMQTIKDVGGQGNPIYKLVTADYVDPIPTMNSAINRAISSTFMDDYKIHAVEHWLAEAMPYFKAKEKEVRSAPFWYFNNADRGAFVSGTGSEVIDNLLSNRYKIRQFTGMPNKVETYIHGATQLLTDAFYTKFGPEEGRGLLTKAVTVVPLWALSKWEDPISGIRSFAFNAKLGLFSPAQFLVQSQTFAQIWALGGRAGGAGTYASMLHQWSRVNSSPAFLQAFDDYASKLNLFGVKWKPGEWIEARNELARSGFEHVGGEYQLADDAMQHKFFKNQFGNFLDAGQVFFREGEKFSRLGAYYTSFKEFRHEFPTKILTDADRASILNRADLLTNNMSRASASSLNASLFSLPTQFLTYQVRMAELFFGKRLGDTVADRSIARARIMGTYAALYGLPGALGVTGYPFGDSLREAAINKGYVPGTSQWQDAVMNGFVSWSLAMISGQGDYQKGNQYDVQGRYGTQGMTFLRDTLRSDKTVWSLMGGAGVDTILSTISHVDPFWQFARQIVTDDEEGNTFKLTPTHFAGMFSEISSADAATRFIYAMHQGKWLSKNESYIEDVTGKDALFRSITGLKSQDQTDIYTVKNIADAEKKVQKKAESEIIKDVRRGFQATEDKDYETATVYFTNARARMLSSGIPLDRRTEIMANANRGYETQTSRSQWTWATKNVPYGDEATRLEAQTKRLQLQEYRNAP